MPMMNVANSRAPPLALQLVRSGTERDVARDARFGGERELTVLLAPHMKGLFEARAGP